jgi:hypothetical protein
MGRGKNVRKTSFQTRWVRRTILWPLVHATGSLPRSSRPRHTRDPARLTRNPARRTRNPAPRTRNPARLTSDPASAGALTQLRFMKPRKDACGGRWRSSRPKAGASSRRVVQVCSERGHLVAGGRRRVAGRWGARRPRRGTSRSIEDSRARRVGRTSPEARADSLEAGCDSDPTKCPANDPSQQLRRPRPGSLIGSPVNELRGSSCPSQPQRRGTRASR